jgi:hypothetical protein
MAASSKLVDANDLALRILSNRGTSTYFAGLVDTKSSASLMTEVVTEVEAELHALDPQVAVLSLLPSVGAASLLRELPSITADVLLVKAESYREADFRLLDGQRSALARDGVTVLFMTPLAFTRLIRVAPNLSSWLAGQVFSVAPEAGIRQEQREARLARLRAWAGKTDAEVVLAATEGRLPRDPEYGEWLVLMGRGDLLDAR